MGKAIKAVSRRLVNIRWDYSCIFYGVSNFSPSVYKTLNKNRTMAVKSTIITRANYVLKKKELGHADENIPFLCKDLNH